MSYRVGLLLMLLALALPGCGGEAEPTSTERSADPKAEAEGVARAYVQAQVDGDGRAMCELRTERSVKEQGGLDACIREATGQKIDAGAFRVLEDRTTATEGSASVVIDTGQGNPIVLELKRTGGDFEIDDLRLVASGG